MSNVSTDEIKELRSITGAGIMDCREALDETDGDVDDAVQYLRKKGKEVLEEGSAADTSEGRIETYTHSNGKGGVILEVNCETDFVAKNEEFEHLAHELCLQIYGMKPSVVRREDLSEEYVEDRKEEFQSEVEGKPEDIQEQIMEGLLDKHVYKKEVLLEQPYFKNDSDEEKTVEDFIKDFALKFDENIRVKRFERFELGD